MARDRVAGRDRRAQRTRLPAASRPTMNSVARMP